MTRRPPAQPLALEPLPDALARETLAYRQALGAFATGVCVVTADDAQGALGVTANSFASVSLSPRLIVWSIDAASARHAAFARAGRFAVHVLGAGAEATARRFAGGDWRLAEGEFSRVGDGPPQLAGVSARFDCATHQTIAMGDHTMIIGRVEAFEAAPGAVLTFHRGLFGRCGD